MRRSTAVLVTLALAGCGAGPESAARDSTPAPTQVQVSTPDGVAQQLELTREDNTVTAVLPADPEAVWNHIAAVYQELGVGLEDLTVYDPHERRIAVADHRARRLAGKRLSLLLNCGHSFGVPREESGDVRIILSTWLGAHEGGTRVTTRFEGRQGQRGSSCESRGRLEQEILTLLLQRL